MNVLEKLSIKNLNLNKKRTTSTVIGIILSCALICAVATMVTSFQASLVQNAISETGYYHLSISNVTKEDIKQLENNRDINEIYSMSEVGYANLKNSKNEYKPYLKVLSMDEPTFEYLKFKLVEGRFPTNDNEIVISEHIITDGEVEYKIGDQITLDIGERKTLDGYDLSSSNPYNKDDEELVNTTSKEFTIVGIIERPDNSFEGYGDPSYTTITTGIDTETKDVYISLKNPRDYKTSISEILGASEYDDIAKDENLKYTDFNINDELLRWEVFAFSDNTISMLYAMSGIVIFIIIFTSVFCIRNSFAISTTEKIKMYGMLASIGATKKQIRKSVIFEAMLIGLIGIPIGILSGILADYVLICIVNNLLGEFLFNNIDGIILKVSGFAIILSIVLSIITIYLSAISSDRKASKVSPIENLKGTDEIKIKKKKLKVPKIISKVFKTGGVLAYKNLKRSKKKYRTTVISLTVSIFIFIAMNSFITNMFGLTDLYYTDYDYNLIFYGTEVSNEEINQIVSLEDVEEYFLLYRNGANLLRITDTSKINEYDNIPLDEDYYFDEQTQENVYTGEESSDIIICALDDVSFKKYAEKIGANYEDIKSSGILYDTCMYYSEDTKNTQIVRRYKYKENDTIIGKYGKDELSIKVGAVADIGPYGIENSYYDGGYLIVDIDEYKDRIDFNEEDFQ